MTDRPFRDSLRLAAAGLFATALVATSLLGGCGSEPESEVVIAPRELPPEPEPVPTVTPVETLMAQLGIDPRVRLAEEEAPDTDEARVGVLTFFDGFVRGDQMKVLDMLSGPDQIELERMIDDGSWSAAVENIARVDVRTGRNTLGDECVLAVFHVGMDFEPQLWTYEIVDAAAEFAAEPTPPGIMNMLSGTDWIAAWYRVLDSELAKAEEPDEKVTVRSVNHDTTETVGESAPSGGGAPSRPGGPGGIPGRRPIGDPVEPPGLRPGQ